MSLYYILILALVQGITEFLPVSSSAHLILLPKLLGVMDQGYQIDLSVHVGTMLAVVIFFRAEVRMLWLGFLSLIQGRFKSKNARFFLLLVISTIPVVVFGAFLAFSGLMEHLRNPKIIAFTMIFFGIILGIADRFGRQEKTLDDWSIRDALIFGVWQAVALIPGTSRSGATVTASRITGYMRIDGAKISMLMSIPTIAISGLYVILEMMTNAESAALGFESLVAALASFVTAYFALGLMMRFLKSTSYMPYVYYRIVLGIVILAIF